MIYNVKDVETSELPRQLMFRTWFSLFLFSELLWTPSTDLIWKEQKRNLKRCNVIVLKSEVAHHTSVLDGWIIQLKYGQAFCSFRSSSKPQHKRKQQAKHYLQLTFPFCFQVAELSNTYYMLMPMARYTYERIKPLNEASDIETHLTALYNLTELALASKILLGAQYKTKGMMRFCRQFLKLRS